MSVNLGKAVAYLELDTSKFSKGFRSAYNDLKVFGDKSATAEQKIKGLQSAFKATGSMLTKNVTLPLMGVGAMATNVAMQFESGMSQVQAISGATGKDFEALKDKAIEMGAKTKFSATESADAFKYMAMAGWETKDMLDGIEGIMNLAVASGEDLASTSDIVTDALTAFGMKANETQRFVDVLARASSRSNTNVALMGETFKYVAPVAGALGYEVEDVAVAIGLMANSGIKGSQAGTALRSTLTRLAKPTKQVQKAIDELGISLTNADGTMKPFNQLMLEMRDRFSGLTEAQKAQYSAMLAGQEGMSGLLAIVNASDEDFQKLTNEINNANGATQEMADIMLNNTKGAVTLLKSALESAGIIIGEQLTPYIRGLAEWITKLVEKFNSLDESQQKQITKWGLILASIGPVLLMFSKLIGIVTMLGKLTGITNFVQTWQKFGFGMAKLGIVENITKIIGVFKKIVSAVNPISAVIAVLIAAFTTLMKTNEEFRNKMTEIWERVKEIFGTFISDMSESFSSLGEVFNGFITGFYDIWVGLCNIIAPLFEGAFEGVAIVLETVLTVITNVVNIIVGIITGDWQLVWNSARSIFETVFYGFINLITTFGNTVSNLVNNVLALFGTSWQSIWQSLSNFFITIWNGIVSFITDVLGTLLNSIITWGSNMVSQAKTTASNFVNNFVSFIKSLPSKVWDIISQIPQKVSSLGGLLFSAGSSAFNQLLAGIQSVGNTILSWVSDFASRIASFVSNIISGFSNITNSANTARNATRSVDGSHADGLSYVPFDGYIAELHKGERVLTKEENKAYNAGKYEGTKQGDTFNFYNIKPDPYTYAKQMKKAKRELLYGV